MADLVTCTRNGCGTRFDPARPGETQCRYHPGSPLFHEGLKGWSCCKTNFTDFSEFLAHPGCTTAASHDATPKTKARDVGRPDKTDAPEVAVEAPPPPMDDGLGSHHIDRAVPMERPKDSVKVVLQVVETPSASKAFARARKQHDERQAKEMKEKEGEGTASTAIKAGAPCLRNACGKRYVDEASLAEGACAYHPGVPVFHEGMKYWSCCERKKFTEFDDCMNHRGCTTGKCKFIPTAEDIAKANRTKCRYDYVQSGALVTVTIYAKAVDPAQLVVKSSVTNLEVSLVYKFVSSFDLNLALAGCVDPEQSVVTIYGTKVEIALKKADGCAWEELGKELDEEFEALSTS